jgi:hypothetical protein
VFRIGMSGVLNRVDLRGMKKRTVVHVWGMV